MFSQCKRINGSCATVPTPPPWQILVVDDEQEVHSITRITLSNFEFNGRSLEITSAYSARQARELIDRGSRFALAFIDVVMESDSAGLELVSYIRGPAQDSTMRIVLRTGQPGHAPERRVMLDLDIQDYLLKTSVSSDKLFASTLAAVRSYHHIITIDQANSRLAQNKKGLEIAIRLTSNIFEQRTLSGFSVKLLDQLTSLLPKISKDKLKCNGSLVATHSKRGWQILATSGNFEGFTQDPAHELINRLEMFRTSGRSTVGSDSIIGVFPRKDGIVNVMYLEGAFGVGLIDRRLINILYRNISIAFENLHLDKEILDTQTELIDKMGEVVETRSKETGNHVKRVARLTYLLAKARGLPENDCELASRASPMHDLGKIAIPDEILLKNGSLDEREWAHMKQHTSIGAEILSGSSRPLLSAAAVIAGQHHEKWDGSGYPGSLSGEQIHIYARIVALVDVFDALIHKRAYKEAWSHADVRDYIINQSGKHFDPTLVDLFIQIFDSAIAVTREFPDHRS
jgi:response regulator RpfG family c-di-GMP phosphodiesterase